MCNQYAWNRQGVHLFTLFHICVLFFRSAREAENLIKQAKKRGEVLPTEKRFDSNCITPGKRYIFQKSCIICNSYLDRWTTLSQVLSLDAIVYIASFMDP